MTSRGCRPVTGALLGTLAIGLARFAAGEDVVFDQHPAWSPDGTRIAFASNRAGDSDLYVMNADGSGVTRVTVDPRDDSYPTWSPDGRQLVFHSGFERRFGLYLLELGSSTRTQLTPEEFMIEPELSPDGRSVVFSSAEAGNLDIQLLDLVSHRTQALTRHPEPDGFPSWSPDGASVLFHSRRAGIEEIYRMSAAYRREGYDRPP